MDTPQNNPIAQSDLLRRITVEPGKCGGVPCIRGIRIRVSDVLDNLAADLSWEDILADFPDLEPDDIRACLVYASKQVQGPVRAA